MDIFQNLQKICYFGNISHSNIIGYFDKRDRNLGINASEPLLHYCVEKVILL